MKKDFCIKTITESLREKVLCGKYSLRKATEELYKAGWINFIDEDQARIILNLNYNDNIL